jgi:hypothetical protein
MSPLLANIALSALDEHFARQWEPNPGKRERRARKGLGNWRICRYADLCRARHKSAYAEVRVMPTGLLEGLPGGQVVVLGAA